MSQNDASSSFDSIVPLVSVRCLAWHLGASPEELYELAQQAESLYRPYQQKHATKKPRTIDRPIGPLKEMQRRIAAKLLKNVPLPSSLLGGVAGRSTKHNARIHVAKDEVVGLDIRSYFGFVTNEHVAQMWRTTFRASCDVVWLLTRLTTFRGHLPQGSPASTALANLVFVPIALEIQSVCRSPGLQLSSWVDDITISGPGARGIINHVARILCRHGFRVARQKTEVMPRHRPQKVTGHIVNQKVSNGKRRLRDTWDFLRSLLTRPEAVSGEELSRARGLVNYVSTTCPRQAVRLKVLLAAVESRSDAAVSFGNVTQPGVARTSPSASESA